MFDFNIRELSHLEKEWGLFACVWIFYLVLNMIFLVSNGSIVMMKNVSAFAWWFFGYKYIFYRRGTKRDRVEISNKDCLLLSRVNLFSAIFMWVVIFTVKIIMVTGFVA